MLTRRRKDDAGQKFEKANTNSPMGTSFRGLEFA